MKVTAKQRSVVSGEDPGHWHCYTLEPWGVDCLSAKECLNVKLLLGLNMQAKQSQGLKTRGLNVKALQSAHVLLLLWNDIWMTKCGENCDFKIGRPCMVNVPLELSKQIFPSKEKNMLCEGFLRKCCWRTDKSGYCSLVFLYDRCIVISFLESLKNFQKNPKQLKSPIFQNWLFSHPNGTFSLFNLNYKLISFYFTGSGLLRY
jgi:hypothetical protein